MNRRTSRILSTFIPFRLAGDEELSSRISTDLVITSVPQPVPDDEIQCAWITEASAKENVLNTPGYPARIPKPRRLDLYEVRPTPDMGLGLFAKRDIKRGDLILAERPLLVAPLGMRALQSATQISEFIVSESLLEAAIAHLPSESQADYKALHNVHLGDLNLGGHLLGIALTNAYSITLYGSDKTLINAAVCKIGSRINHRCLALPFKLPRTWLTSFQLHA